MAAEKKYWRIYVVTDKRHKGKDIYFARSYHEQGIIAIGWGQIGPLGAYARPSKADTIEALCAEHKNEPEFDGSDERRARYAASVLYRFYAQIKSGDVILLSGAKGSPYFYVGEVRGDYRHDKKDFAGEQYYHIRDVNWRGELCREAMGEDNRKKYFI